MHRSLMVDRVRGGSAVLFSDGASERVSCAWATTINVALAGRIEVQGAHTTVRGRVVITPPGVQRLSRSRGPVLTVLLDADSHRAAAAGLPAERPFDTDAHDVVALASSLVSAWAARPAGVIDHAEMLSGRLLELGPKPLGDPRFERVMASLSTGTMGVRPLQAAARATGLSASHFSERFSRLVGVPLKRWLVWQRVRRSLLLLGASPAVGQVAADVGFSDHAHMTKTYASLLGYTPTALAGALR